ncbi:MAG: diaminopimelate epimerase, partial [bacterium]
MEALTKIPFFKFSATGNDFILIDNREGIFSGDEIEFFQQICQRRTSIGADGVLLIENSAECDFRMRYFNADGSEATCGNGARSAAFFAHHCGIVNQSAVFLVQSERYEAEVKGNMVKLKMPVPRDLMTSVDILEEHDLEEGGFVNTGVPHYVLFGKNIAHIDVDHLGCKYRWHTQFHPEGSNVNFVEVVSQDQIKLRTYERGVENETLSCGTGCVASAYLAAINNKTRLPTEVLTSGGRLRVYRDDD